MQRYRSSPLWQRSKSPAVVVYRVTAEWPSGARFGLTSQTRRAAISVMGNIAEGQGRSGGRELKHRLSIANGSLCEMEAHLLLGIDLGFNTEDEITEALALSTEVGRMLTASLNRLE